MENTLLTEIMVLREREECRAGGYVALVCADIKSFRCRREHD